MKIYQTATDKIIAALSETIQILEPDSITLIINFIKKNQRPSGGFCDRSGREDLYYSFFGYVLCKVFSLEAELALLHNYIQQTQAPLKSQKIEQLIKTILSYNLQEKTKRKKLASLKSVLFLLLGSKGTPRVYSSFIGLLALDGPGFLPKIIRKIIAFVSPLYLAKKNLPASHLAALLIIKNYVKSPTKKIAHRLMQYPLKDGSFPAFLHGKKPDLLSTAVSLYALSEAGADISLLVPGCLDFITANFDNGAFLSGDGDRTRDLEYTVYGLLALASLSRSITKD